MILLEKSLFDFIPTVPSKTLKINLGYGVLFRCEFEMITGGGLLSELYKDSETGQTQRA